MPIVLALITATLSVSLVLPFPKVPSLALPRTTHCHLPILFLKTSIENLFRIYVTKSVSLNFCEDMFIWITFAMLMQAIEAPVAKYQYRIKEPRYTHSIIVHFMYMIVECVYSGFQIYFYLESMFQSHMSQLE